MKVFKNKDDAFDSLVCRDQVFIDKVCPFKKDETMCGNWCPAFYKSTSKGKDTRVILQCFPVHIED